MNERPNPADIILSLVVGTMLPIAAEFVTRKFLSNRFGGEDEGSFDEEIALSGDGEETDSSDSIEVVAEGRDISVRVRISSTDRSARLGAVRDGGDDSGDGEDCADEE